MYKNAKDLTYINTFPNFYVKQPQFETFMFGIKRTCFGLLFKGH